MWSSWWTDGYRNALFTVRSMLGYSQSSPNVSFLLCLSIDLFLLTPFLLIVRCSWLHVITWLGYWQTKLIYKSTFNIYQMMLQMLWSFSTNSFIIFLDFIVNFSIFDVLGSFCVSELSKIFEGLRFMLQIGINYPIVWV